MKKILILVGMLSIGYAYAQQGNVGINNNAPKATLHLEVAPVNANNDTNQGILIPRLTKSRLAKIDNDYLLEGTLVYIKEVDDPETANAKVNNVSANGFYYYDGAVWQPIQKSTPKFDYVLSTDGSVLMQWMNKYTENIDMNDYADMADVKIISQYLLNGSKVKSFTIRNGVTTIGAYAFADNPDMEISTLPTSITTIDNNAFQYNKKITQVHLPNLTTIGEYAFYENTAITSVDLPNVTKIGSYAFQKNIKTTTLNLPKVITIENNAFADNTALTSISLPQATTIGDGAFSGNTALTSISLPQATTIGDGAFSGNTALTSISLPQVTTIGSDAFADNTSLTSISLPQAITIGSDAFYGNTSLTTISLPKATTIGNDAFYGNTSLTTISLPKATTIGNDAFYRNTSLTSVTLPSTIKK